MKANEEWRQENGKYKCPHCGKEYHKMGINSHIFRTHSEKGKNWCPTPSEDFKSGKRQVWCQGKTKDTDERVLKRSETVKERYANGTLKPTGWCSIEYLKSDIHRERARKGGGYREKAGRSKKFHVSDSFGKIVCLQSTYELRCSEILNELDIKWIRPTHLKYNGDRKYFADFYLVDFDVYLDPKNDYKAKLDKEKIDAVIEQNNVKVFILLEKHLNKEFIMASLDSVVGLKGCNPFLRKGA